jgi:hypothetical protein
MIATGLVTEMERDASSLRIDVDGFLGGVNTGCYATTEDRSDYGTSRLRLAYPNTRINRHFRSCSFGLVALMIFDWLLRWLLGSAFLAAIDPFHYASGDAEIALHTSALRYATSERVAEVD